MCVERGSTDKMRARVAIPGIASQDQTWVIDVDADPSRFPLTTADEPDVFVIDSLPAIPQDVRDAAWNTILPTLPASALSLLTDDVSPTSAAIRRI